MVKDILLSHSNKVALLDDTGREITYRALVEESIKISSHIEQRKSLVVIESSQSLDSIFMYVGCLLSGHVPLILDAGLAESLKRSLLDEYLPNYIFSEGVLTRYSGKEHSMHEDLALLLSTSGSTGAPKLVKLTMQNILANASSISSYLNIGQRDRAILNLPIHYSFGLSILNSHLTVGASIVVTAESLFSKSFWNLVKNYNVTSISGVPYTFEMLKRLKLHEMELPSIRYLSQAGGKMSEKMIEWFHTLCKSKGWDLFIMYGQTEATARMSYLNPSKLPEKIGSVGQAIPQGQFDIVASAQDKTGEIIYSGPNVMMGYANRLDDLANGDELKGILHTGDIGYKDSDGDLYITGRSSRFIKIYGLRFNLDQIENTIKNLGYDVAVGGGDDILKVVTSQPENLDKIKSFIIETFKINHRAVSIEAIEAIVTTQSGKIDYKAMFGN